MARIETITARLLLAAVPIVLVILAANFIGCAASSTYSDSNMQVDYRSPDFDFLSEYGEWVDVEPFGEVWHPDYDAGWAPFYYGHWELCDRGWTWMSYEPFGWLVYHHGNWCYQNDIGWFWIPGYEWEPERVEWISYDEFVGWAPLPPEGYSLPQEFEVYDTHVWNVVHVSDILREDIWRYRLANANEFDLKTASHQFPEFRNIELQTGRTITPIKIKFKPVGGGNSKVERIVPADVEKGRIHKYGEVAIKEAFQSKAVVKNANKDKSGKPGDKQPATKESKEKKGPSEKKEKPAKKGDKD